MTGAGNRYSLPSLSAVALPHLPTCPSKPSGPSGKRRARDGAKSHGFLLTILLPSLLLPACDSGKKEEPTPVATEQTGINASAFSGTNALEEVRAFVAVGPRHSGTPGAEKAAQAIHTRLKESGVSARIDEFTDDTPSGKMVFRNVLGEIRGNRPGTIILITHYDTKSGISDDFIGANDSGSSTGLLLELAELLQKQYKAGPTLLLAFVDGEECSIAYRDNDGLHGSRHLARQMTERGETIIAAIVADMIGDKDLTVTIPRNCTMNLVSLAFDSARAIGKRSLFSLSHGAVIDDHVPFFDAGIPALNLIDFHFGSAPRKNDYWHTPKDTLDKLSPDSLETVGRVILHIIDHLAKNGLAH
jgi:glutaminyl-peptide cyclotransferase